MFMVERERGRERERSHGEVTWILAASSLPVVGMVDQRWKYTGKDGVWLKAREGGMTAVVIIIGSQGSHVTHKYKDKRIYQVIREKQ